MALVDGYNPPPFEVDDIYVLYDSPYDALVGPVGASETPITDAINAQVQSIMKQGGQPSTTHTGLRPSSGTPPDVQPTSARWLPLPNRNLEW